MGDISNKMDFDFNENHSATNINSNDSGLLNVNTENGHLTVISPVFTHSTPVINESVIGVNTIQSETSTVSFTKDSILSNNSDGKISVDAGVAMTESINSLNTSNNLIDEAISYGAVKIDNFKTVNGNSLPENKSNFETMPDDSFSKTINLSLESAIKNIKYSPLKTEIVDINPESSHDNSTELNEPDNQNSGTAEDSKNSENILCPITMDVVDFSFKDSEDISNNISGNLPGELLSEMPDSSTNNTVGEVVNHIADLNLVEDAAVIHVSSKEQKSLSNIAGEDVEGKSVFKILENVNATENPIGALISERNVPVESCTVDSVNEMFQNLIDNPVGNFSNTGSVLKVPENPVNKPDEDFSDVNSASEVPENSVNKPIEDFSNDSASKVPESLVNKQAGDFSINVSERPICESTGYVSIDGVSQVVDNPINKPVGDFPFADTPSQMPDDPIHIPVKGFSNAGIEFKVPESPMNKQLNFSDASCNSFKNLDVGFTPACFSNVDSMDKQLTADAVDQFPNEDFAFKISDNQCSNPIDQLLDVDFGFKIPENPVTNECDEEFTDAVQFFKDPNSFQFLENIKTSVQPESTIPRSSLYVKFDPLLSKFSPNAPTPDNCALLSAAVKEAREISGKASPDPELVMKHLVNISARESIGNVLISFDSPKPSVCKDTKTPVILPPPKLYTEDELQQKLKISELTTQEVYLKKQREMELEVIKRDKLLKIQNFAIEELLSFMTENSDEFKKAHAKIELFEAENKRLREDLKTSAEDLQSVENTFADFHKRYEQCKGMLKTYKENEEHLKQVISDLQNKIKEHEQMYCVLQERTEDMLEKANNEVTSVKRVGEAQVTVLKAQLKKAEMKISSLESDIKQIKIENSQLGGICDDLMAKVSRP